MGRARTVYFAMIDGQEVGPITRAEFALRVANSLASEETYVWSQGMSEWLPAAKVEDLVGIFQLRQKARKEGLRPPPPPAAAMTKTKPPVAAAPPPPPPPAPPVAEAPKKPSFRDYELAAPRSRPGAWRPPPPLVPDPPKAQSSHPSEATPSLDELQPPVDDDSGDEHTTLDLLPLGERVHQEEVASSLFTSSGEHSVSTSGSTGAVALDEVKFAASKSGLKQLSTSVPLTTRPSPAPPPPPPEPPRKRGVRGLLARLFRR